MTATEHLRAAMAEAVAARVGVTNPDTRLLLALLARANATEGTRGAADGS